MFHTKNKQGVVMHPTSVFATDPEVLLVPEEESRDTGNVISTHFLIWGDQTCFADEFANISAFYSVLPLEVFI